MEGSKHGAAIKDVFDSQSSDIFNEFLFKNWLQSYIWKQKLLCIIFYFVFYYGLTSICNPMVDT